MDYNYNYCIISQNKMYDEIHELLVDDDLHVGNESEDREIENIIFKYISNLKCIEFSKTYTNNVDNTNGKNSIFLDDIMFSIYDNTNTDININTNNNNKPIDANTITIYANENITYEIVYIEHKNENKNNECLNHFASISNMNLLPMYRTIALIKTDYSSGINKNCIITKNDIYKIIMHNFYHVGVMVDIDGDNIIEITYSSEYPYKKIGNNFMKYDVVNIFGMNFIVYYDENKNKNKNENASIFCNKDIYCRIFISLLSYEKSKKIWDVSKCLITKIIEIKKNNELFNKINDEIIKLPCENYLSLIAKYIFV